MLERLKDYLLISGMGLLMYWQVASTLFILRWDAINCFLAWRFNVANALQNHELPMWSTFQHLGFPLGADPETGAWYPPVWIIGYFLGYDFTTLQIEWVLHIILAGCGLYALSKSLGHIRFVSLIAGISFMAGGMFVSNAQNFIYLIGIAWFPWVFLYLRKWLHDMTPKNAAAFALCSMMLLTGSYPGITIIAFYTLGIYAGVELVRLGLMEKENIRLLSKLKSLTVLLILLLGLSAGWILSTAEFLPEVSRTEGLQPRKILENPLSTEAMISFITPYAVGTRTDVIWNSDFSMINTYAGLLSVVMFLVWLMHPGKTKREWILVAVGVVFFAAAVGRALPIRMWLTHLPGMELFRHPSIFRFFGIGILILFTAEFIHRFWKSGNNKWLIIGGLDVVLILGFLAYLHFPNSQGFQWSLLWQELTHYTDSSRLNVHTRVLMQAYIQLIFWSIIIWSLWKRKKEVLLAVVCLDALIATQLNVPSTVVYPMASHKAKAQFEWLVNAPKTYDGESVRKINSAQPPFYIDGIVCNHATFIQYPAWDGYNSYNLKGYIQWEESKGFPDDCDHPLIYTENELKATDWKITNNSVSATFPPGVSTVLVFQQYHHSNWKCFVDGKPTEITSHGVMTQKLNLMESSGNRRVEFKYDSKLFLMGSVLSMCTLIVALGLCLKR